MALGTQEIAHPIAQELAASAHHPPADVSTNDLAELMAAFTEVTTKLEKTHGQLRSEVHRLNTELHQANEALQRSRRLAALGEMAAGISHEIRNPLGSIRLYANMLVEDLAEMPEQQQIVEKIGRAVRGLDEIVGDVLTFAREMKVHWHLCDASSMIDHAIELCCAELEDSIIIRDDREADPLELMCDSTLIQQALVNILRNAGEANRVGQGTKITIGAEPCVFDVGDQQTQGVVFSIRDEGDGMSEQVIERMFNPFFTTRATGTGLGLAIVHRIIDAHRGKVEVHNAESDLVDSTSGAVVELYVPRAQSLVVSQAVSQDVPARDAGEIVIKPQRGAVHIHGVS